MDLKRIFSQYNCGTSAKKIAEEQLSDKENKNKLISLFALTGIGLAYRYVEEEKDPWDDRNRKSKEYSYANKDRFMELFKEYSGKEFPDVAPGGIYLSKMVRPSDFSDPDFAEWLSILNCEHPTLVQCYFRGMVQALCEELGLPDEGFPYI